MGIYYSTDVVVGFMFTIEEILDLVEHEQVRTKQSHYEDRFCSKTGKKLESELIIDKHEACSYTLWGEEIDPEDYWSLNKTISEKLQCKFTSTGGEDDLRPIFYPKMPKNHVFDGVDAGEFSAGPSYSYKDIIEMQPRLQQLRDKLGRIGLICSDPVVANAWSIC